jgi:hypothetical protein
VHARHYHNNDHLTAGVGTVYRIDLSAATRDVLGAIDIRVSAEDMDGNSIELQLEPALYIGDRPRHRAVRP